MTKRCYCGDWVEEFANPAHQQEADYFFNIKMRYCPWCGKPLAESQSQQKRLKVQLGQKNA